MTVPTGTAGFSSAILTFRTTASRMQETLPPTDKIPTYQWESHVSDLQFARQGDVAEEDLAVVRDRVGVDLLAVQRRVERALGRVELDHKLQRAAELEVDKLLFDEVAEVARDPHGHRGEVQAIPDQDSSQCVGYGEDRPFPGGKRGLRGDEAVKEELPRIAEILVRLYGPGKHRRIGGIIWKKAVVTQSPKNRRKMSSSLVVMRRDDPFGG